MKEKLAAWAGRAVKEIYPDRCPVCDRALFEKKICPECLARLHPVRQPSCMKCGKPLEAGSREEFCLDCAKKKHYYIQGKAVWEHRGAAAKMLYRYKYQNRRDYTDFLVGQAAALYKCWISNTGAECIMPIPLHPGRRRKRGYNQAELLADGLSKMTGLPLEKNCLIRTKATRPQKELSGQDRKNNLKNAFNIRQNVVQYRKVLLVDDIYTTGSTIDSAAIALSKLGVKEVYFLCMSIGLGQ